MMLWLIRRNVGQQSFGENILFFFDVDVVVDVVVVVFNADAVNVDAYVVVAVICFFFLVNVVINDS